MSDLYWCEERLCNCFVGKDHRCEQWSNTVRIPAGVVGAIRGEVLEVALRWLAEQCTDVDVEMSPGMGRLRRKQVKSLTDAIMNMGNVRRRERALPLLADGFEGAVEGIGERCGQMPLIVYSVRKCLDILVSEGMSEVEAREYFDFNVGGAWMGEGTPIWVTGCDADGVEEYLDGLSICQEDTNPPA